MPPTCDPAFTAPPVTDPLTTHPTCPTQNWYAYSLDELDRHIAGLPCQYCARPSEYLGGRTSRASAIPHGIRLCATHAAEWATVMGYDSIHAAIYWPGFRVEVGERFYRVVPSTHPRCTGEWEIQNYSGTWVIGLFTRQGDTWGNRYLGWGDLAPQIARLVAAYGHGPIPPRPPTPEARA